MSLLLVPDTTLNRKVRNGRREVLILLGLNITFILKGSVFANRSGKKKLIRRESIIFLGQTIHLLVLLCVLAIREKHHINYKRKCHCYEGGN